MIQPAPTNSVLVPTASWRQNPSTLDLPVYCPTDFGAAGNGQTDDTNAWAELISVLGGNPGRVELPPGFNSLVQGGISLDGSTGMRICAGAGPYSPNNGVPLPRIFTTRSDGGPLISCKSAHNLKIQGVNLYHGGPFGTSASVIDASGTPGAPTQFLEFDYCSIQAIANTASAVLLLRGKQNVCPLIHHSQFIGGNYGILGMEAGTDVCNGIGVKHNLFQLQSLAAIASLTQGVSIHNNAFEPLAGNSACGIWAQFPLLGASIEGNVFEDNTAAGTYIRLQGNGVTVAGNYFYGPGSGTGIQFVATSDGIIIQGNGFKGLALGIDKNGQAVTNTGIGPNSYASVTSHHNFAAAGAPYIEA